jgi:DNA-binding MarR family transcriptional regulator
MAKSQNSARHRDVLVSLRRIIRAIDLHSRSLIQRFGLTGPQLIILEVLVERGECTITELSEAISLSMATVTGILSRLESRGLIERRRDDADRRKVLVRVTPACDEVLSKAPTPLQESFISEFDKLQDWEQALIVSSLQRIVTMMEATKIDATPMLVTGAIDDSAEPTNDSRHPEPSSGNRAP